MSTWRKQSGEGKAGCVVWTLLLVIGGFVAFKVVPIKIADMRLLDEIENLARHHNNKTDRFFRDHLFNKAEELFLPVEKKNIQVKKTQRWVRIQIEYTVPVDFIVTTYHWEFKHDIRREVFLF